jgi:hypothetical protein
MACGRPSTSVLKAEEGRQAFYKSTMSVEKEVSQKYKKQYKQNGTEIVYISAKLGLKKNT